MSNSKEQSAILLVAAGAAGGYLLSTVLSKMRPFRPATSHDLLRGGTGHLKLEYFDIAGVAEKVRLALAVAGVPFEDVRVPFATWQEKKPTMKYQQLPVMTLPDGREVHQSDAMLRWAGSLDKAGRLYPEDAEKRLKVEEALGLIADLVRAWSPALYIGMRPERFGYDDLPNEKKSALVKKLREKFLKEELPKYMKYFTDLINASGRGYLCGEHLTIADLSALHQIKYYSKGVADYVPKDSLDPYPEIKAWIDRVEGHPAVVAYYGEKGKK